MKIILLPGASDSNKEWVDTWATFLEKECHEVCKIYYDHWGNKDEMFSFEKEAIKLSKLGKSWEQSVVVAKSIGTLLAVYCVSKNIIKPSKAVFLGFPSKMNGEKDASMLIDLKLWLNNYFVDTKIFQNENDPVTSFVEVQKFIEGHKALSSEKVPGNTHKYLVETYSEKVLNYL